MKAVSDQMKIAHCYSTCKLCCTCAVNMLHTFPMLTSSWHLCWEKKRKENTTPFGVNLMRSPVLYRAAQASLLSSALCVNVTQTGRQTGADSTWCNAACLNHIQTKATWVKDFTKQLCAIDLLWMFAAVNQTMLSSKQRQKQTNAAALHTPPQRSAQLC